MTNSNKVNRGLKFLLRRLKKLQSSIYGRVIYIIVILAAILFVSYSIILRSVYSGYINTTIRQCGNNIVSIVGGALYNSMLLNDRGAMQGTMDIIHTMPGIDEVNLYDHKDSLVYSSHYFDPDKASSPDCIGCHPDMSSMFPSNENSYRIIDKATSCAMNNTGNGHRQLFIRSPIYNDVSCYTSSCHAHSESEQVLGSLIIKIPLKEIDKAISRSSQGFFFVAFAATVLIVLLLILFTRRQIKNPLNALLKASEAVANGDRSMRLEIKPGLLDDMKTVSVAFNNMLDNLHHANKELENWSRQLEYKVQKKSEELSEIQNELIHVERIASLGKLSSSVAHEINNPLSGVLTYTKLVHKQLGKLEVDQKSKESMMKYLSVIEAETKRCGDIVKGLLDFSRKDQKNFENRHLHKILKETHLLMAHEMKIADIHFYTDFNASEDLIYCGENQIKQACVAILVNSSEAITENGEIVIRTVNPDENHVRIDISDNGVGIAPEALPHIFEPFFSNKQKTSGIGLGLAIVHGICQSHNGKIEVKSELGKGTTMSVTLPVVTNKDKQDDKKDLPADS